MDYNRFNLELLTVQHSHRSFITNRMVQLLLPILLLMLVTYIFSNGGSQIMILPVLKGILMGILFTSFFKI